MCDRKYVYSMSIPFKAGMGVAPIKSYNEMEVHLKHTRANRQPYELQTYEEIGGKLVTMRLMIDMDKLVAHFGRKAMRAKNKKTSTGYGAIEIVVAP